jgi:ABC-type branched-subunit amino acid transport system ATPase component
MSLPPDDGGASALIAGRGLVLRYATAQAGAPPALDGVDARVSAGRITGLVGPDGAGKTSLMRLLAGLMHAQGGELSVLGLDPARQSRELHERIGYMPQKFGLYEDLSVGENLRLYAEVRGLPGAERKAVFERLLAFTGLAPFTARLAGRLSGGMKQKLGLACAMIRRPELLLWTSPAWAWTPFPGASCGAWCANWPTTASAWSGAPRTWTRPRPATRCCCSPRGGCCFRAGLRSSPAGCRDACSRCAACRTTPGRTGGPCCAGRWASRASSTA